MKVPQFLSLNASKHAVSDALLCQAIVDNVNRELAARIHEHGTPLDRMRRCDGWRLLSTRHRIDPRAANLSAKAFVPVASRRG
jgi:hypothetical protein